MKTCVDCKAWITGGHYPSFFGQQCSGCHRRFVRAAWRDNRFVLSGRLRWMANWEAVVGLAT